MQRRCIKRWIKLFNSSPFATQNKLNEFAISFESYHALIICVGYWNISNVSVEMIATISGIEDQRLCSESFEAMINSKTVEPSFPFIFSVEVKEDPIN